jgi:predicted component of viral defense system (DUF524 family)
VVQKEWKYADLLQHVRSCTIAYMQAYFYSLPVAVQLKLISSLYEFICQYIDVTVLGLDVVG